MAKMLDALERARQEREKKLREAGQAPDGPAAGPVETPPAGPQPTARTDGSAPAEPAAPPRLRVTPPNRTPGSIHSEIAGEVVGIHDNRSPIAEQVRQIRTNLENVLQEYRTRSIVITSPIESDGKTLVTANLAVVLADDPDHEVLLIDADMRKPDQHNLFGVRQAPGLSEYLQDKCTLEEAIQPTSLPNLKIIAGGRIPDKPTVLLSSNRMINLLGEVQRPFRWVVFDTPPLLPVTDASVLARECVGLILVLRMGQTHRRVVEQAQQVLAEMRLPVLGCILNDFVSSEKEHGYYNTRYRYGHK